MLLQSYAAMLLLACFAGLVATLFVLLWNAARSTTSLVLLQLKSRGRAFAFYRVAPWFWRLQLQ